MVSESHHQTYRPYALHTVCVFGVNFLCARRGSGGRSWFWGTRAVEDAVAFTGLFCLNLQIFHSDEEVLLWVTIQTDTAVTAFHRCSIRTWSLPSVNISVVRMGLTFHCLYLSSNLFNQIYPLLPRPFWAMESVASASGQICWTKLLDEAMAASYREVTNFLIVLVHRSFAWDNNWQLPTSRFWEMELKVIISIIQSNFHPVE